MSWIRRKTFAVVAGGLAAAALMGGSLGVLAAGNEQLSAGFNIVGGPTGDSIGPDVFVSCLPQASWNAVYVWNSGTQKWQHYFNTTKSYPAFLNQSQNNGMTLIPKLSGVILMMDQAVSNTTLKRSTSTTC